MQQTYVFSHFLTLSDCSPPLIIGSYFCHISEPDAMWAKLSLSDVPL